MHVNWNFFGVADSSRYTEKLGVFAPFALMHDVPRRNPDGKANITRQTAEKPCIIVETRPLSSRECTIERSMNS